MNKMKRVFKKPYIFWLIGIFLIYLALNISLSGFYNTIPLIIKYSQTVNWFKLITSLILTLAIASFVATNSILVYIQYKERKNFKKETALTSISTAGGLITGVCPLCVTGLVPLLLSAFGISFSFASLPLQGIEIQILVLALLSMTFLQLKRK